MCHFTLQNAINGENDAFSSHLPPEQNYDIEKVPSDDYLKYSMTFTQLNKLKGQYRTIHKSGRPSFLPMILTRTLSFGLAINSIIEI